MPTPEKKFSTFVFLQIFVFTTKTPYFFHASKACPSASLSLFFCVTLCCNFFKKLLLLKVSLNYVSLFPPPSPPRAHVPLHSFPTTSLVTRENIQLKNEKLRINKLIFWAFSWPTWWACLNPVFFASKLFFTIVTSLLVLSLKKSK